MIAVPFAPTGRETLRDFFDKLKHEPPRRAAHARLFGDHIYACLKRGDVDRAPGVREAVAEKGVLGAFTGGLTASAGGIAAAICFGFLAAAVFRPKEK